MHVEPNDATGEAGPSAEQQTGRMRQRVSLDAKALEVEQARLLYERAPSSAFSVFALVVLFSAIMVFVSDPTKAAIWFLGASAMIGITLLQPRLLFPEGVSETNAPTYLNLHTFISGVTGAVWGFGAAWLSDTNNLLSVYSGLIMVVTITLGGISPQSAFRRSYVALATLTIIPFAVWLLVTASWPLNAIGIGLVIAYAFFMSISARVEIGTRDTIAAKRNLELTEQLRVQRDAVQRAIEEKTRFLAATSHDLAQPLHAQGFYLAALREKTSDPAVLELIDKVSGSWRSLGQLLDGLVEISRLDAGAIVPDLRPIDLLEHVRQVSAGFEAQAAEKQIDLSVSGTSEHVLSDPALLSRVVGNLISNAIKFTPKNGAVRVSVRGSETSTALVVEDSGAGIPETARSSVFDEYVQLGNPERNREKGLGLGLSIVKRLAALLSLDIAIDAARPSGTRVTVGFPSELCGTNLATRQFSGDKRLARDQVSSLCVLIVDDEEAIRMSMAEVLTSWGCEVYSTDGKGNIIEFLDRMDATPNMIIADRNLGERLSGLEIIEAVRDELNQNVPAVLMTGDVRMSESASGSENTHILFKPVDPVALRQILMNGRQAPCI